MRSYESFNWYLSALHAGSITASPSKQSQIHHGSGMDCIVVSAFVFDMVGEASHTPLA